MFTKMHFLNEIIKSHLFTELPNDYVLTFGASDAFSTTEYVILENKNFTTLSEVCCIIKNYANIYNIHMYMYIIAESETPKSKT